MTRAIAGGEAPAGRSVVAKSLAAALRSWEQMVPDEFKQPVAWIASDR